MAVELTTVTTTWAGDDDVGLRAGTDGDDAECSTSSTVRFGAPHLVHAVLAGVNCAGETVAATVGAFNADTPIRHVVTEGCHGLEVDGIPAKLEEGLAVGINICACDIWGPVAPWAVFCAPDASFTSADSGRVDIVVSCSTTPIVGTGVGESSIATDLRWDDHGFVARKNGLTERHNTTSIVDNTDVAVGRLTVGFVGEGFRDLATVVAVQTTVLRSLVLFVCQSVLLTIDLG